MEKREPHCPNQATGPTIPIKRHVFGPFGDVGYVAKKPGHGAVLQSVLNERTEKTREERGRKDALERMQNDKRFEEFWVHADMKSVNARAARFVELGMEAQRRDLEHKKNLLKVKMLNEESSLTQEYISKAQKSADMVFDVKRKKAEELESQAKESQKTFVQQAYERIFRENCDELRTKTQQERRKALNDIHKKQMCEKIFLSDAEKEEEKLWIEYECQEDERRRLRSEGEKSAATKKAEDYVAGLDKQIEDVNHRRRNEACVESLEEAMRQEIVAEREKAIDMRDFEARRREEAHLQDLFQQLEANRVIRMRLKEEEDQLDKMMIDADKKAADMEKAAIVDNRSQLRSELAIFKEARKQYNDSMGAHEKIIDAIYEEQKAREEMAKETAKREEQRAKAQSLKNCIEIRKRQVEEKEAKEKAARERNTAYAQLLKIRLDQNELLDACPRYPDQVKGKTAQYAYQQEVKENAEFEKYGHVLRQREQLEMDHFVQQMRMRDEEIERKTKELLSNPPQSSAGGSVHPFTRRLMGEQ